MRIASLLSSATEIVYALGLGDRLAAVSHECDYPAEVVEKPRITRPRFFQEGMTSRQIDEALRRAMREHGSAYVVDETGLREASPDFVLTQAVCEVCAVSTSVAEEAVAGLARRPEVISLDAHRIEDIFGSILAVGSALGVQRRANDLVAQLRRRVADVVERVRGAERPTVLAVEWLDPLFVPGHWVPEMFDLAGGRLLSGTAGDRSRQLAWDDVKGLDPDVLIVMPCGLDLEATRAEADKHADRLRWLAPRAVESGNAFVVDGSAYFSRSGPRFVTGIEILAAVLHPDRFGAAEPDGGVARCPKPAG